MSNNDPLGIKSLQETIRELQSKLNDLEKVAVFGEELPVSESRIIQLTDIPKGTLLSLRNEGKLSFSKVGKTVLYLPSQFKADLIKAGTV